MATSGAGGQTALGRRTSGMHMNSARSALLTVISLFVYPDPKPVPTSTFIDALEPLGFGSNATRQALQRSAASGWITATKVGRQAHWHLTGAGYQLFEEGAARIARLSDVDRPWDGRALILTAEVPENDRAVRHQLRTRLDWLGFAALAPGVWISTHVPNEIPAGMLMEKLSLPCNSYVAEPGTLGVFRDVVWRSWDLAAVERDYQAFLDEFRDLSPVPGTDRFVALVQVTHRWRRFPFVDPGLPPALLPAQWTGFEAARLFAALRAMWRPSADEHWHALVRA
ncbi:PaaX family transcriptional regulator C-terminal domain-containing protein [Pseudonocardia ailaonensis]|uniref:PaaX family transcriptional regulator C-terminal domain-containing protein n=1 Tax=Pseudonocardia ailaonensis TaxID=367279 RepID=A0ABN2NAH3_9PSEU